MADPIFQPLAFRNLTLKNRLIRSNISGRFDNYDGSGNPARINWETRFARGGVGAILSSFVPVHGRGRILPNYAMMDADNKIPFWREVGKRVHEHDCKFILQLSHGGRQRDIAGVEYPESWSSTSRPDPLHGFEAKAMTVQQIGEVAQQFGQAAERAQRAGLDGVELHGANGYLITQFLSSGINDRTDDYGGTLENRARFVLDIVRSIRQRCGPGFHLQMKISATENNNAMSIGEPRGNTIQDSVQVCQWLEAAGVDAIHVSGGSFFPHPRNPAGDLPIADFPRVYDSMLSSGRNTLRNYLLLRNDLTGRIFHDQWVKQRGQVIEGLNLADAAAIKRAVQIPVICTGGFQTASVIRQAIENGQCDAVSMARTLVANPEMPKMFAEGLDRPPVPCTYCNKCLVNVVENPLGCYDETRYMTREAMVRDILSVFDPPPYPVSTAASMEAGHE
ncbi:MAG TPA: NADH:flavin oxidoreductase [Bryobacteraceae bacterium]|nr:NADH:flavin oxidoreductase [Bryobacteraceae bacterium]